MDDHMPGWIVSPRCAKSHMTRPQVMAANPLKMLALGGMGRAIVPAGVGGVGAALGMKEASTREAT